MLPSEQRPWLKYYPAENIDKTLPRRSLYTHIRDNNQNNLSATAIYFYGSRITYGRLLEKIDETARAFAALGVRAGDVVSIVGVATPETVAAMYALNKMGAVSNFIDPRMSPENIRKMITDVRSRLAVTIDRAYPKCAQVIDKLNLERLVVLDVSLSMPLPLRLAYALKAHVSVKYGGRLMSWPQLIRAGRGVAFSEAPYEEGRMAVITYTGGTTGLPKGVMLTDDGLNAVAVNFCDGGIDHKEHDRFLDIMPIFSSYGVVCGVHMPLSGGLEDVIISNFTPDSLGHLVKKYRCPHMLAVPAYYELMMNSREMKNFDLSFMGMMGSGGDTMNEALEDKLHAFMKEHGMKYKLAQGYGLSECSAAVSFSFNNLHKSGSVGIPSLHVTVGIFKPDTGEELPTGREGEICITGPTLMKGYYNAPEETDIILRRHADGRKWIHSGDIGYLDEDGFLFVKGRSKLIIIRYDGHKIFPIQLESFVRTNEYVSNCAVVAVTDMNHGQGFLPLVVVELRQELPEGVTREDIRRELLHRCNTEIEERGHPADVVLVDKIPITPMGKNDITKLGEEYINYDYGGIPV